MLLDFPFLLVDPVTLTDVSDYQPDLPFNAKHDDPSLYVAYTSQKCVSIIIRSYKAQG